jgi:nitrogen fixation protein FixH
MKSATRRVPGWAVLLVVASFVGAVAAVIVVSVRR